MRLWDRDGSYSELPTGAKAVDLLKTEKGPRCVAQVTASVIVLGSIHVIMTECQVRGTHEGPNVWYWFYRFHCAVFEEPLSIAQQ
jgi:hypothetical protein